MCGYFPGRAVCVTWGFMKVTIHNKWRCMYVPKCQLAMYSLVVYLMSWKILNIDHFVTKSYIIKWTNIHKFWVWNGRCDLCSCLFCLMNRIWLNYWYHYNCRSVHVGKSNLTKICFKFENIIQHKPGKCTQTLHLYVFGQLMFKINPHFATCLLPLKLELYLKNEITGSVRTMMCTFYVTSFDFRLEYDVYIWY